MDFGGPLRRLRRGTYGAYFDLRHHVRTAGRSRGPEHRGELKAYEPSETWQLLRMLPPGEVRPTDTFVDIGCGKGRVLVAAARHYDFRRIIGVELSADIHRSASDNIARMRPARSPIELTGSDACSWPIPPDATVFYLFNPFTGETFRRFAANLLASQREHPRHLRIVYVYPVMHDDLIALGFTILRTRRNQVLYSRLPTV